jgi:hypothetical protein
LTGLTPTFNNWTTNPGTTANLCDELSTAALTTAGVAKAAPGSSIVYDLGSSARRIFMLNSNAYPFSVWFSDDDVTYWQQTGDISSATKDILHIGKFRYVKALLVGAVTIAYIKMRCYNFN